MEQEGEKIKKANKRHQHTIFSDWCKKCGICVAFCPRQVLERDGKGAPVPKRPQDCIGCRLCELRCPDFAITVKETSEGA